MQTTKEDVVYPSCAHRELNMSTQFSQSVKLAGNGFQVPSRAQRMADAMPMLKIEDGRQRGVGLVWMSRSPVQCRSGKTEGL